MRIILSALVFLIASSVLLSACGTVGNGYNPTVFDYHFDEEALKEKSVKKVAFAPVSLGKPVRAILRKGELRTKAMVKRYLTDHNYELIPTHHFENAWKQAIRSYGEVYDPSTGQIDMDAWRAAMVTTGKYLRENTDADIIVFADLLEHEVQHSASMKHYARWYGVTRKPSLQGAGDGVPLGFEWSQSIKAASLIVTIYDVKTMERLFSSRGGIDTLYAIDIKRANPTFVRRKKLLKNSGFIQEGIQLAFHPFITMEDYPKKQKEDENKQ
ncbi:MAG: hypothetical protein JKY66_05140 [Spongiibacteraceae bacterium]|nr:hypothetical protein [Spongiibacteraceae bacterium]